MPPSDPRVRQMNDAQWLWSYYNVVEDEREEEKKWKTRLTFLGWFTNPEAARNVSEQDNMFDENGESVREGVYKSDDFGLEAKAASLGFDPNSGLTPAEFLEQYYNKNSEEDLDIMTANFDELLASGKFTTISESDDTVGNKYESQNDFLSRVSAFEEMADESIVQAAMGNQDLDSIDPESEMLIASILDDEISMMESAIKNKATKQNLNQKDINEEDLDIIIFPEEEGDDK